MLGVGGVEGYLDIYSIPTFRNVAKMRRSGSPLIHIDWTKDSVFVQVSNTDHELLYFDAVKALPLVSGAAILRDAKWETWASCIGWPVQGIYNPSIMDATFVAAQRSPEEMPGGS